MSSVMEWINLMSQYQCIWRGFLLFFGGGLHIYVFMDSILPDNWYFMVMGRLYFCSGVQYKVVKDYQCYHWIHMWLYLCWYLRFVIVSTRKHKVCLRGRVPLKDPEPNKVDKTCLPHQIIDGSEMQTWGHQPTTCCQSYNSQLAGE